MLCVTIQWSLSPFWLAGKPVLRVQAIRINVKMWMLVHAVKQEYLYIKR